MKKKAFLSLLFSLSFYILASQVPQGFNYQAVAYNSTGAPVASTTIQVRISILYDTLTPVIVWEELHASVKTNASGVFNLVIGTGVRQSGSVLFFSDIDWTDAPLFIRIQINAQGTWKNLGSAKLWSVPYSMVAANLEGTVGKLEVIGEDDASDEALFEVKRKDGETMFAVYNHGVRINMPLDTLSKTRKGGFIVAGFDNMKGIVQDYLVVNPDSIRAYIDTNAGKTRKGGFAVGGFGTVKTPGEEYLRVTRDSTRVYINDLARTIKGGFAVGGFNNSKGNITKYLKVTPDSTRIFTKDPNAGFAIQDVSGEGSNYLHIKPENMFIGKNAGEKTVGLYNSFFGYQSGLNNSTGAYNIFIGYESGRTNTFGGSNIFLGPEAGFMNMQGAYNVFIGHNSGYSNEVGHDNVFVGQRSGYSNLSGNANLFVGQNSGENNYTGTHNVFLGYETGKYNINGTSNVYLGAQAGFRDSVGSKNVFLGYQAGFYEKGSDKLYIENSEADKTGALIYGDFNNNELRLNAKVGIYSENNKYLLNVDGDINFNGQLYQNGVPYNPGLVKVELTEDLSSPEPYQDPPDGLLVFNSGTLQPKGFFYWDGDNKKWLKLIASATPSAFCDSIEIIINTGATIYGHISDDGGTEVVTRGFCWGTSANPTINGSHSLNGSGIGIFETDIINLPGGTKYYVRAYAQNQAGIDYSNQLEFDTNNPLSMPTITTSGVKVTSGTTAISGGEVSFDGGTAVTARGVCWSSTNDPPSIMYDPKTTNGTGTGEFTSSITSLSGGTKYYLRSYATNIVGTSYGNTIIFYVPNPPEVQTDSVYCITSTSARSHSKITNPGGNSAEIIQKGVCWDTTAIPDTTDNKTNDGAGTSDFVSTLSGLTEHTTYHLRAYAKNVAGTSYGNEKIFTTDPDTIKDRVGNIYNVIRIGTQLWMKENLKTTKFNNGSAITLATDNNWWDVPRYGWYDDDKTANEVYGALYNYLSVENTKLCPKGWHVPTDNEWTKMENYLIANGYNYDSTTTGNKIAKALASTTLWELSTVVGAVGNIDYPDYRNKTGFTGLPAGYYFLAAPLLTWDYLGKSTSGYWWSSTKAQYPYYRAFTYTSKAFNRGGGTSIAPAAMSVRCVKD